MATREERSTETITTPPEVRRQGVTRAGQWERWAPLAGIIFVVLMFTGTFLVAYPIPAADAPAQQIADYLADSGTHTRNIIGAYIWVVGALSFLLFVTRLRSVLRTAQGGILPNVVFGAGVIYSALMMASGVTFAAVAYAVGLRDAPVSNPDLVRVLPEMAWMFLLLGGGFAGILLVLATCIVSFQTGVLPRWLAWLGIVAAIVLLFDVIYVNILPLLLWVLAASIVLLMRREQMATAAASAGRRVA
jgi:Domain of unknown function (DUF4386)